MVVDVTRSSAAVAMLCPCGTRNYWIAVGIAGAKAWSCSSSLEVTVAVSWQLHGKIRSLETPQASGQMSWKLQADTTSSVSGSTYVCIFLLLLQHYPFTQSAVSVPHQQWQCPTIADRPDHSLEQCYWREAWDYQE
jgi:hypothetical protein